MKIQQIRETTDGHELRVIELDDLGQIGEEPALNTVVDDDTPVSDWRPHELPAPRP